MLTDKLAKRQLRDFLAKLSPWKRIKFHVRSWIWARLRISIPPAALELEAWLDEALQRRASATEVKAHLLEVGLDDERAAPLVNQYMHSLHAGIRHWHEE